MWSSVNGTRWTSAVASVAEAGSSAGLKSGTSTPVIENVLLIQ